MANGNTLIAMLYLPWQNLNTCTPSWHPWFDILQLSHISNPQYTFSQALEPQTLPGESYMGSSSLWAPFQGFAILKGSQIAKLILWDIFEFFYWFLSHQSADSPRLHISWVTFTEAPFTVGVEGTTVFAFVSEMICSRYELCIHSTHSWNRRSW